jgi:two-component system nitrate/nitrite response regulator NarL
MRPQPSNFATIVPVPISVIIAYSHPIMPSAFARTLGEYKDINVLLACSTGKVAAVAIQQFVPDVALLDVEIFDLNVLDVLSRIAADGLKTRVVCLTASPSGDDLVGAIAMGARGILFKDDEPGKVVDCIREVFHGKDWLPSALLEAPPDRKVTHRRQGRSTIRKTLTAREREIALLVCDGLTNKQLGAQLNLTEGTVKVHLHKIYRKLGLRNRAALSALVVASRASLKSRRGKRSEVVGHAKLADLEVLSPDDIAATSRMTGAQRESLEPLIGRPTGWRE